MRLFKNERGYTMLFTVVLIILFTILGLSLLSITSNGITKNEVRQSTSQSLDLAEKGITYISEQINQELVSKKVSIDNETVLSKKKTLIQNSLNNIITKYSCSNVVNQIKVESETGISTVCISKAEDGTTTYSKFVTFKSIGKTNQKEKTSTLLATSEIGFSNVPEALNYAVSTNEDGNLYLFGGIEIVGNVKVANTLYSYNKAFWSSTSNPIWEESVLPYIKSQDGVTPPKIYSNNVQLIKENLTPSRLFTTTPNISKKETITNNNIQSAFNQADTTTAPVITKTIADNEKIDVNKIISTVSSKVNQQLNGVTIKKYGTTNFNGVNGQNGAVSSYKTNDNEALYIPGNMRIGRYSANGNYSNDIKQYREFNLNGNYYINGDLVISGAKLKGNAVIYVKGNVDIEFSTINAEADAKSNTIFIFAEKPIEIHNISVNSTPGYDDGKTKTEFAGSYINGFFYTNSNFLMYGVGSNTKITGGVSAKHTMFTALRGYGVDELHKNDLPPTESTCSGDTCSCERNDETSDDREISISNRFEMVDKELLITNLNKKKNEAYYNYNKFGISNRQRNEYSNQYYAYEKLINLATNPYGAVKRTLTANDVGKDLYLTKEIYKYNFWYGKYIFEQTYETQSTEKFKENYLNKKVYYNFDNNYYLYKLGREYKYTNGQISFALNYLSDNDDEAILKSLLKDIYLQNSNTDDRNSNDKCLTNREQLDKGNASNNKKVTGDYRYTSRLTIVYNNDLIKRYTETNAIEVETTNVTVIPVNIRDMTFE